MKRLVVMLVAMTAFLMSEARTLVVYYSYTNNVHNIVTALNSQIEADVIRIQPSEKGLDYAANNYAIGSAQIAAIRSNPGSASSYPAIDPVDVDLSLYDCVIIGAPLWWSNMAAPLQTFLFQRGGEMAGKKIGLIVSSASSGISGVEGDARRLVPDGEFLSPSLWIRSSQTSKASSMISSWLDTIGYDSIAGISGVTPDQESEVLPVVYDMSGRPVAEPDRLSQGIYIVRIVSNGNIESKKVAFK